MEYHADFAASLRFLWGLRDGFHRDAHDPSHWSDGVAGRGVLRGEAFGLAGALYPALDLERLTRTEAAAVYHARFWQPLHCGELPLGVDLMVFDHAVTTSAGISAALLHGLLGARGAGAIWAEALARCRTVCPADLIDALAERQQGAYERAPDFPLHGLGWTARLRLRHARASAVARDGATPWR